MERPQRHHPTSKLNHSLPDCLPLLPRERDALGLERGGAICGDGGAALGAARRLERVSGRGVPLYGSGSCDRSTFIDASLHRLGVLNSAKGAGRLKLKGDSGLRLTAPLEAGVVAILACGGKRMGRAEAMDCTAFKQGVVRSLLLRQLNGPLGRQ